MIRFHPIVLSIFSIALLGALAVVSFLLTPSLIPDSRRLADLEIVEARLREAILDLDPGTADRMKDRRLQILEILRDDGSWPDIDYRDRSRYPWKTVEHLERVAILAQSHAILDSSSSETQGLGEAAIRGLVHWLENDYESDNWWYNQIYVPKLLGYILLSIGSEVPEHLVEPSLHLMSKGRWRGMTGQNLVWVAGNEIVRGCLLGDPAVVRTAYDRLYDELRVAERGGEGIQADASFHQHGPYLNSGSYGASFAKDTARCLAASWDTEFQAPEKVLRTYLGFLLEGQQWMVFQGLYDYSTWGRAIVRPKVKRDPETYFNESINRPIRSLSELGVPRAVELRSFLDRWEHRPDAQPLVGHRHFWKSDYTVHRGRDYTITLRMHSERTINAEFINGEGGTTHFLADGAVFLYREVDEYQDIFAVWDWRQIPGTTCVQSPAPLGPEEGLGIRGSTRFVGGVSNGRTGVSAMDLEKEFLKAKKAWFFFKDEIVCLGAGITSADGEPVATSIEQRLLEVPVRAGSGRDMQEVTGSYAGHPEWILHDGVRYKFPTRQEIRIEAGPKQGRWSDIGRGPDDLVTKGVFQIWIDHGITPREATYEYRIVPGFTSANGEELEGVDPRVVFSNTRNLQAVYDPSAKTLQAVFWRGGRVVTPEGWEFSVDEPCLFQAVIGATEVEFSLANPENEPLEVRLTTSLPLDGLIERGNRRREILIDLPDSEQAGASLTNAYAIKRNQ